MGHNNNNRHRSVSRTAYYVGELKGTGRHIGFWKPLGAERKRNLWSKHGRVSFSLFSDSDKDLRKEVKQLAEKIGGRYSAPAVYPALRYRWYIRKLKKYLEKEKAEQAIILGSGFDIIPALFKETPIKFFEVDQENIIQAKRKQLEFHNIHLNVTYIEANYLQRPFDDLLNSAKVDRDKPTVVIWEGNLAYLERSDVEKVLQQLHDFFRGKLNIALDWSSRSLVERTTGKESLTRFQDYLAEKGTQFKTGFDKEDIEKLAQDMGFKFHHFKTGQDLVEKYKLEKEPDPELSHFMSATLKASR